MHHCKPKPRSPGALLHVGCAVEENTLLYDCLFHNEPPYDSHCSWAGDLNKTGRKAEAWGRSIFARQRKDQVTFQRRNSEVDQLVIWQKNQWTSHHRSVFKPINQKSLSWLPSLPHFQGHDALECCLRPRSLNIFRVLAKIQDLLDSKTERKGAGYGCSQCGRSVVGTNMPVRYFNTMLKMAGMANLPPSLSNRHFIHDEGN